ncbi:hypothetical protein FQN49_006067, partial [Arthroderma sp. PD_2]
NPYNLPLSQSALVNTVSHSTIRPYTPNSRVSLDLSDTLIPSPSVSPRGSLASEVGTVQDMNFGSELCRTQGRGDGNRSLEFENARLLSWLSSITPKPQSSEHSINLETQTEAGNRAGQLPDLAGYKPSQHQPTAYPSLTYPDHLPIAAQEVLRESMSPKPPCLAPLTAISLQTQCGSILSLPLTTSSSQLPSHLRFMVEAIDRESGDYMAESRQCSRARIPPEHTPGVVSNENEDPSRITFSKLCSVRSAQLREDGLQNASGKQEQHPMRGRNQSPSTKKGRGPRSVMPLSTNHNQPSFREAAQQRGRGTQDTRSESIDNFNFSSQSEPASATTAPTSCDSVAASSDCASNRNSLKRDLVSPDPKPINNLKQAKAA